MSRAGFRTARVVSYIQDPTTQDYLNTTHRATRETLSATSAARPVLLKLRVAPRLGERGESWCVVCRAACLPGATHHRTKHPSCHHKSASSLWDIDIGSVHWRMTGSSTGPVTGNVAVNVLLAISACNTMCMHQRETLHERSEFGRKKSFSRLILKGI